MTIRAACCSDLHNEFEHPNGPRRPTAAWFDLRKIRRSIQGHPDAGPLLDQLRGGEVDLIVLAGDIDVGVHGITYADRVSLFLGAPVVYVAGNHENYGMDLALQIPEMRSAAAATCGRVTFLENESKVFDIRGERLHALGCTMWSDYELNCEAETSPELAAHLAMTVGGDRFLRDRDVDISHAMHAARHGLNDHQLIRHRGRSFTPEIARELHHKSRRWLGEEVARIRAAEGEDAKILIVTHHAPIPEANPPQYRGGKLSPAFASDMTNEIKEWAPTAWCFGHCHWSMETQIGKTKLISSQRGYVCAEPGADEYLPLVVEI